TISTPAEDVGPRSTPNRVTNSVGPTGSFAAASPEGGVGAMRRSFQVNENAGAAPAASPGPIGRAATRTSVRITPAPSISAAEPDTRGGLWSHGAHPLGPSAQARGGDRRAPARPEAVSVYRGVTSATCPIS